MWRFENAFWSVGRLDKLGISVWIEKTGHDMALNCTLHKSTTKVDNEPRKRAWESEGQ
ncbi:hypothetical protein Syun_004354 [Stephania yunnanensis]|uniref:Uncharacterized protein n=1 Tax=Stephania yunnanensis TaxID=152371 RepID=A0AAP0L2W5_9MAGN